MQIRAHSDQIYTETKISTANNLCLKSFLIFSPSFFSHFFGAIVINRQKSKWYILWTDFKNKICIKFYWRLFSWKRCEFCSLLSASQQQILCTFGAISLSNFLDNSNCSPSIRISLCVQHYLKHKFIIYICVTCQQNLCLNQL